MSDDVARKPCPGCNGANLIPWFGTLCSWCQRFPAHIYPAATSPAAARAELDRRPLKMLREDRERMTYNAHPEPLEPLTLDEVAKLLKPIPPEYEAGYQTRRLLAEMVQRERLRDEHARHRARFKGGTR